MADQAETGTVSWGEILNVAYGPSLAVVCLGVWLHAADSLLVATMLPAIVAEIGGEAMVAWTIALYDIGSIVAGAASALLAMRYGLRLSMSAAALVFAGGCAVSAIGQSMEVVLIGRLLQGLGGGGLVAMSFVGVGQLFPRRLVARAMAAVSTFWGMSAFLGPLIGGLFVEFGTWRGGFWFFAVQALALATWVALGPKLGSSPAPELGSPRFPFRRLFFLSAGVVLIAYGGLDVSPLGTSAFVLAGLACLLLFLRLDGRRGDDRLLPFGPFNLVTPVGSSLTLVLCFSVATIAITAYGPLLVTALHGTSALVAGYIVACSSIGWSVAAVLVSGAAERHDPKIIAAGMIMVAVSIVGFAYSMAEGPVWLIAVCSAVEGAGFGLAWTFILRRITALAPLQERERVAGAIPTVQRLGYALGAAYIGIVANAAGFADAERGATASVAVAIFVASLPFAALGLVATARFVLFRSDTSYREAP